MDRVMKLLATSPAVRALLLGIALLLFAALAACSGGSEGGSSAGDEPTATPTPTGTPAATTPASTAEPSASATPSVEASPTPGGGDPSDGAALGIEVLGDHAFIAQADAALQLLDERAPAFLATVDEHVETIRSVEAGSGMDVATKTYLVGNETAFAPGYPPDSQVVWLAGTIVHDACHSEQFTEGREIHGQEAELECLATQHEALELLETGTAFQSYVTGLIEGADDPANQYWNTANRHW